MKRENERTSRAKFRLGARLLAALTCCAVLAPGQAALGHEDDDERRQAFEQFSDDMQRIYRVARDDLASLSYEDFSILARQSAIGDDAEALFAWVRDETRWVDYQGSLRGPRGVLMDRTGSHLDRAMLLAALLESAGHRVRLARATLTDAEAAALADITHAGLPALDPAAVDPADYQARLKRTADTLDIDLAELRQDQFEAQLDAQRLTERVIQQGDAQSRSLAGMLAWDEPAADDRAVAAASPALRDHWWVQLQTDAGWLDLDPASREHAINDRAGAADPEAHFALGDLPDEQHHTLRIEVVAEQLADGELVERVAVRHDTMASELIGGAIVIGARAVDWPGDAKMLGEDGGLDPAELREQLLTLDEWIPILDVAGEPVADKSIMADGSLNEQPGASAQAEAVHEAVGLLGAIGGGGDDEQEEPTHLTAVTVRFTVEAPGREPMRYDRPMVDVLGPAQRAADPSAFEITDALRGRRAFGLMGSTRLLAQSCWIPDSYTLGRSLDGLLQNRQAALGSLYAAGQGNPSQMATALQQMSPQPADLLALAHQRRAASLHRHAIAITRLNLLGYVHTLDLRDGEPVGMEGFDIIENAVDVLPDVEADARRVRLTQGVIETVLEAELLAPEGPVINAARQYGDALATGERWQLIGDTDQIDALGAHVDADTRTHLRAALAAGQLVVLPDTIDDGQTLTWWRVDASTGAALGMGLDGRGQAGLEYLVQQLNAVHSVLSALAGVQDCLTKGDPAAMACCTQRNAVNLALGMAFGKALGNISVVGEIIYGGAFGKVLDMPPDPC